ncbi:MAG: lamin tail domain-containing protein [bacterium]
MDRQSLVSVIGWLLLSGCVAPELHSTLDLSPPAVVGVSLGALDAPGPPVVSGLATITVRLSEPLERGSVTPETVLVIRGRVGESCAVTGQCLRGHCLGERCRESAVDTAFRDDANSPPLSVSRQGLAHPMAIELDARRDRITLQPQRPFDALELYTLMLSSEVRDDAGNPLAAADGTWQGFTYDFVAEAAPAAPPVAVLVVPSPESVQVPPNLAEVVVGFTQPVFGALPAGIWLTDGQRRAAAEVRAAAGRCPEAHPSCVAITLTATLAPSTRYSLAWDASLTDTQGEPVPWSAAPPGFTTGAEADLQPPEVIGAEPAAAEGCLVLTFSTDEPARSVLRLLTPGSPAQESTPGEWSETHRLVANPPPETAELFVRVWDLFDNAADYGPYGLEALSFEPTVVISEVRANPAGAEPAQELVELVNLGSTPTGLQGWRITDDPSREGDTLPAVMLAPGAVVLVVPQTFDQLDDADPQPDPAALIVRVDDGTLGSGGLSNSGEPVHLFDDGGVERSYFPGTADDGTVPANGQSVIRVVSGDCLSRGPWVHHPGGTSSPGWLD